MSYTLTFDALEELAAARAVEEHFTTEGRNAIDLYIQRNLPEWEAGEKVEYLRDEFEELTLTEYLETCTGIAKLADTEEKELLQWLQEEDFIYAYYLPEEKEDSAWYILRHETQQTLTREKLLDVFGSWGAGE